MSENFLTINLRLLDWGKNNTVVKYPYFKFRIVCYIIHCDFEPGIGGTVRRLLSRESKGEHVRKEAEEAAYSQHM